MTFKVGDKVVSQIDLLGSGPGKLPVGTRLVLTEHIGLPKRWIGHLEGDENCFVKGMLESCFRKLSPVDILSDRLGSV